MPNGKPDPPAITDSDLRALIAAKDVTIARLTKIIEGLQADVNMAVDAMREMGAAAVYTVTQLEGDVS